MSAILAAFVCMASTGNAAELKTKNVVLITTDGLRWQEVFTGAEKELINKKHGGVADAKALEEKYWRETPEERRAALLPFFWSKIASEGQIYGNLNKGSSSQITNTMKFSYPGYNEILTGFADPLIDSNDKKTTRTSPFWNGCIASPRMTARWPLTAPGTSRPSSSIASDAAFPSWGDGKPLPEPAPNPRQQLLNELIADTTRPNATEVIDSFLYQAAREHLLRHKPRVFFIGFLETDAWGHAGRYDNLLNSANAVDQYVQRLWETMQSMEEYRDKTTFILSTDHGRGSGLVNWKNHGKNIEGAEDMWMAFLGPDTPPLGERTNCDRVTQSQIAATLAALLREDYHAAVPRSGAPIEEVLPSSD
ncbi:MAG: alkaline phosphatase family protein [Planctomycetota bacterium]